MKSNISDKEVSNIELIALIQPSRKSKWQSLRLYRITASNFYFTVANSVQPSSKLKVMYYSSFSSLITSHGKHFESHVRALYTNQMIKDGYETLVVNQPGLIISKSHPYVGASLDGIVTSDGDSWGLEIKCPFSKYNSSLTEALKDKKFFLIEKQKVELKRGHSYFYQIQCQMFCTGLQRVDLVVWFGDQEPLFILPIFMMRNS